MEHVNFLPWEGKYYQQGFHGKRILVLGDSHYCDKELADDGQCHPECQRSKMKEGCHSFTSDVMLQYLFEYRGEQSLQCFLCFERAINGREINQAEKEEFWNSVIFYNFFQNSQKEPGCEINVTEDPEIAFKEILEKYMPDLIIIWGCRLYNYLPDWDGEHSIIYDGKGNKTDIWNYKINGKIIPAMKVHHPSWPSGKRREYWHNFYRKFIGF